MNRQYDIAGMVTVLLLAGCLPGSAQTLTRPTDGTLVSYKNEAYQTLLAHAALDRSKPKIATMAAAASTYSTSTACWAAWAPNTAYSKGAQVSYNGQNYLAASWSENSNPATNSGTSGSGEPWIPEGSCGIEQTTTQCWPGWVSSVAYSSGAQVSYNGENYQAAYWSQNSNPVTNSGAPGSGEPWIPEGACAATQTPESYRVQVYSYQTPQIPPAQNWTLRYQFVVPPTPNTPTWNYQLGTVYQWGDVDFDDYGSSGSYPLSSYGFNQIVPQLIIGNALDGNNSAYAPSWTPQSSWGIQSQYYWYNPSTNTSYAQTGKIVAVKPGDVITTSIAYTQSNGTIVATISDNSISGTAGASTITIPRPFPNDPTLFTSWADFFKKAAAASGTSYVISEPVVDVETYSIDNQTFCNLLPFTLDQISIPGVTSSPGSTQFGIQQLNGYSCAQSSVQFNF